jgi:uncharacterized protein YwqG
LIYLVIAIAIAVALQGYLLLTGRHIWFDVTDAVRQSIRGAKEDLAKRNRAEAAASDPLTQAILAEYRALARPALLLVPDPSQDALDAAACLGGPVWLADGETWPLDGHGRRLEFVAQYDLSRLPPLADFPTQGVARFFVGQDDIMGANWDVPDDSGARELCHDGPMTGGRREEPEPWDRDSSSPFGPDDDRANGVALRAEPIDDLPDYYSWQVQAILEPHDGNPGLELAQEQLWEIAKHDNAHRIGGYPRFTQYDFRAPGKFDELDVLVLGLTSDHSIMWGDVGEAMFLIRQADLDQRDLTRMAFYWDCY